jgi:hypothetical protein
MKVKFHGIEKAENRPLSPLRVLYAEETAIVTFPVAKEAKSL